MTPMTTPIDIICLAPCDIWEDTPDPRWLTYRRRREQAPAAAAPSVWFGLDRQIRRRLCALCVRVDADYPTLFIPRAAILCLGALRVLSSGADTIADMPARAYTARFAAGEDAAERAAWRAVEAAIAGRDVIVETLLKLRARRAAGMEPAA